MNNRPGFQIALLVFLLASTGVVFTSSGQVVDSLAVPADSLTVPSDSLAAADSVTTIRRRQPAPKVVPSFRAVSTPMRLRTLKELPSTAVGLEVTDQLAHEPGVFLFDLSTPGWPSALVTRGKPLAVESVSWNGLNFDELFTGRPAYELLPRGLLDTLAAGAGTRAISSTIATTRGFEQPEPLTELNYRTSNKGMQYVYASHQQQRVRTVLGDPTRLGIRVGYMGEKADGEYPGSKLERVRGVYGSFNVQRGPIGLEISDLANRRRVGAHAGVIPAIPGDPDSIYGRFGALVRNSSAERRTIRNDLTGRATYTADSSFVSSMTSTTRWTRQSFRYRSSPDTLFVKSERLTQRFDMMMEGAGLQLGLHAVGSTEKIIGDGVVPVDDRSALNRMSILGSASYLGAGGFATTLGLDRSFGQTWLQGNLDAWYTKGVVKIGLESSRAVPDIPMLTATGFGNLATVQGGTRVGYVSEAVATLSLLPQSSVLEVTAFFNVAENPRDWFETSNSDSVSYLAVGSNLITQGVTLTAGFRNRAKRGYYIDASITGLSGNETGSVNGLTSPLAARPEWYGSARSGFRYLMFKQDLDADISLRARYWSNYAGRVLHPATGLLVVPLSIDPTISSSAVLDFVFEGGIRGATITLSYENLLSGTELILGNQLVPGYPLAQRRLRFGVYWPILN